MVQTTFVRPPLVSLKWPAYAVALTLVVKPLLDAAEGLDGFFPGAMRWRAEAIAAHSGVLVLPVVGLLLAFATAYLLTQHRVLRFLTVLCGALAFGVLVSMAAYALDVYELRTEVPPGALLPYALQAARTVVSYGLSLISLSAISLSGSRALAAAEAARREVLSRTPGSLRIPARRMVR